MQLIEIRLETGILIVGTPLAIDPVMVRADDAFMRGAVLRKLHADRYAMARIRTLYPMLATQNLDPWELVERLGNDLRTGRLRAVFLRESGNDVEPVELPTVRSPVVHLELPGKTILMTARGLMPPQFRNARGSGVGREISRLDPEGPEVRALQRQADRLGIDDGGSGADLQRMLVAKLSSGQVEAVALTSPGDIAMARARRETPVPPEAMTPPQRVAEAILRSRRYLSGEIRAAVGELVKPENLATMAAVLLVAAAAQLNPFTAALIDSSLVAIAWISGGMAAVQALGLVFGATMEAAGADSEDAMETAAEQFAKSFAMLGGGVLQLLMARSFSRRGGTQGQSEVDFGAKMNVAVPAAQKAKPVRPAPSSGPAAPAPKPKPKTPAGPAAASSVAAKSLKNEVTWKLDAQGRPISAEATLSSLQKKGIKRGAKETDAQDTVGARGLDTDDAGHVIGHRFMGDQGEKNLFPQDSNFNRGAYKTLENEWAAWIQNGGTVKAKVNLVGGTPDRPDKVEVVYRVFDKDGKQVHRNKTSFSNKADQEFDRKSTKDIKKIMGRK